MTILHSEETMFGAKVRYSFVGYATVIYATNHDQAQGELNRCYLKCTGIQTQRLFLSPF